MSFQRVILLGNLGADPELKETTNGTSVVNVSLATNDRYNGEDRTEWHRVVFWAKTAETIAEYCSKGQTLLVEGELRTRSWEGDDGVKKYTTEVHARNFKFVGAKATKPQEVDADNDDLPFDV